MRSQVVLAAALLGIVACSRSPAPDTEERASTVLPAGDPATPAVVSPVEAHAAPEAPAQPRAGVGTERSRAAARPSAPAPESHASHATGEAPARAAAAEEPVARVIHSLDTPAEAGAEAGGGKPRPALNEGPVPDPYWPGRGAVIIRGGNPRIDDDCALHPRGGILAGTDGTLINPNPSPTVGTLINDRGPDAPVVGADPVARGGPVLNNPDPRPGTGPGGTISSRPGMPSRTGGPPRRAGGIR